MSFSLPINIIKVLRQLLSPLYVHMLVACKQTAAAASSMAALTVKVTVNVTVTLAMAVKNQQHTRVQLIF